MSNGFHGIPWNLQDSVDIHRVPWNPVDSRAWGPRTVKYWEDQNAKLAHLGLLVCQEEDQECNLADLEHHHHPPQNLFGSWVVEKPALVASRRANKGTFFHMKLK